jgi:hypothetical protein
MATGLISKGGSQQNVDGCGEEVLNVHLYTPNQINPIQTKPKQTNPIQSNAI